jgi:hypothetical protein
MSSLKLQNAQHVKNFYSFGTYSIEKNELVINTEVPDVTITGEGGKLHSLELQSCFDISSNEIPCIFTLFKHNHPTNREKLPSKNTVWQVNKKKLSDVFLSTNFPKSKILVITMHDEDFEEWHLGAYRLFVERHVTFDESSNSYNDNIQALSEFIDGASSQKNVKEEPRTVSGGVLDPS